jgi:hypothetical protein
VSQRAYGDDAISAAGEAHAFDEGKRANENTYFIEGWCSSTTYDYKNQCQLP